MFLGTLLIVLTWTLFIGLGLPTFACIILTVIGGFFVLLGLLFVVYFFNLDMKMMALLEPLFIKIYDKRKRNRRL